MSNNIISFRLPGYTARQAGRFIGIDRDGAMVASRLDDKLLGIYFILEVKHIFSDAEYYTDLHCIKTYNFYKQSDTNTDGIISTSI
jgi:pyrimidine operon attenuation protein/uracil phosphoribosyltransferase